MSKKTEVAIATIKLKVGDTEIELTLEQARELKELLKVLFPEPGPLPPPVIIREIEKIRKLPYSPPMWPQKPEKHPWEMPIICMADGKAEIKLEAKVG